MPDSDKEKAQQEALSKIAKQLEEIAKVQEREHQCRRGSRWQRAKEQA